AIDEAQQPSVPEHPPVGGGGGGGGGTPAPDTEKPKITEAIASIENGVLVITVTATDNVDLAELEVDHSLEGLLPEFTVPAKSIEDLQEIVEDDRVKEVLSGASVTFE